MGDGASPAASNVGVRRGGGGGTGTLSPAAPTKINLNAYSGADTTKLPADNFPGATIPDSVRQARQDLLTQRQSGTTLAPPPDPTAPPISPATPGADPNARVPQAAPGSSPATPATPAAAPGVKAGTGAPVQKLWTQTDAQGNPSGVGTIGGQQYVRDGSWWVKKSIVDANPGILGMQKGQNPQLDDLVEKNRMEYSQGVTTMATEMGAAQRAAKTTATGYDSEAERQHRSELANSIGVNWKSDENQNDPQFVAKQVLAEELYNGHLDALPGTNMFFSYHGGAVPWTFKDRNGSEVPASPELVAQAQKAQQAQDARMGATGGSGTGGAPPPLLAHGGIIKKTPGGKRLSINGKPAIVGEGSEDEAVMPLSVLSSVVEAAAARGAGRQVSPSAPLLSPKAGAGGPVPKLAAGGIVPRDRTIAPGEPDPGTGMPNSGGGTGVGGGGGGFLGSGRARTVEDMARGGDPSTFAPYAGYTPYQKQGMSAQEQAQLQAITKIAQQLSGRGEGTYNVGSGAYNDAVKYFQTLTKGNRGQMMAAVAPSAELIREQGEGAKSAVLAGQGRSGLKDMALSGIDRQAQGDIARLTAGVQSGAAGQLGALGGQGIQLGNQATEASGQLSSAAQQALTQSRQYEEGLGESSRQFGAGLEENSRQFGASFSENSRQFNANLAELVRSNTIKEEQAQAAMNAQRQMQEDDYKLKLQQFQESIRQFGIQTKTTNSANKGQAIGAGLATVATIAVLI